MIQSTNIPIGYWLKKVDQLITDRTNEVQAANGVSRLEWQTLNTLFEKESATAADLQATLAPFTDMANLRQILARFIELNWLEVTQTAENAPLYWLNSRGTEQHQRILQAQQAARGRIMQGISAADYATVIQTLQQMAANLEMIGSLADNG
jgi:DNA-binding MarR family transcriptional regulator